MKKKQRHHYVPRFYLEGFIDPKNVPLIWIYEKGNKNIIKAAAADIAVRKDYYSFTTVSGEKDSETFEDALAELESKAAPLLQKIKNEELLTDEEKGVFSFFVAYTMTRVPNYRQNIEDISGGVIKKALMVAVSDRARFESDFAKLGKMRGEQQVKKIEDLIKLVLSGQYDIHVHPQFSLGMIDIANELAPVFYRMNWAFIRSIDEYKFVTSDNPLYYYDPTHKPKSFDGVGLTNENTEVCFPLSRDLLLLCSWKKYKGYYQVKNKNVKEINRRTVIYASRFVFSSQKSHGISILVDKYKKSHPNLIIKEQK